MRLYSKTHEWFDTETKEIGITNFAAEELGDIVFVGLPCSEDELIAGDRFADIESVKAVAEIYSPVSGSIAAINVEVIDSPELINEDADKCWLVRADGECDIAGLMTEEEYKKFLGEI